MNAKTLSHIGYLPLTVPGLSVISDAICKIRHPISEAEQDTTLFTLRAHQIFPLCFKQFLKGLVILHASYFTFLIS